MQSSLKDKGGNLYKLEHIEKKRLEGQGELSSSISCDEKTMVEARVALDAM